jgi:hypothetical protein
MAVLVAHVISVLSVGSPAATPEEIQEPARSEAQREKEG